MGFGNEPPAGKLRVKKIFDATTTTWPNHPLLFLQRKGSCALEQQVEVLTFLIFAHQNLAGRESAEGAEIGQIFQFLFWHSLKVRQKAQKAHLLLLLSQFAFRKLLSQHCRAR